MKTQTKAERPIMKNKISNVDVLCATSANIDNVTTVDLVHTKDGRLIINRSVLLYFAADVHVGKLAEVTQKEPWYNLISRKVDTQQEFELLQPVRLTWSCIWNTPKSVGNFGVVTYVGDNWCLVRMCDDSKIQRVRNNDLMCAKEDTVYWDNINYDKSLFFEKKCNE